MGKFQELRVPNEWRMYWSHYPEGYTVMEALINWASQTNGIIDNVNEWNDYLNVFVEQFDKKLQPHVRDFLNLMWDNGQLAEIINNDVFNMKANKEDLEKLQAKNDMIGTITFNR